jgi:hypothetical protein
MNRFAKFAIPAVLVASLPVAAVLAQTRTEQPRQPRGPSPEVRASLLDGRVAMIKTSLKLTPEQLKLWEPVEAKMRADFADRQKLRDVWRQKRAERRGMTRDERRASREALPDRIDQSSQRLVQRAERLKAYAEVLRPFYAALSDDQKAVANIVLERRGGPGHHRGHRFAGQR